MSAPRPATPRLRAVAADAEARVALGTALLQQGQYAAAVGEFDRALGLDPDLSEAHLGLGSARFARADFAGAADAYRAALALNPEMASAHFCLGMVHFHERRHDDAEREFLAAIAGDPSRPLAHFSLGCIHLERGEHARAVAEFEAEGAVPITPPGGKVLVVAAFRAQTHVLRGDACRGLGDFDRAVEAYRAALKAHRRFAGAYHRLGDVAYLDQGRPDEAEPRYEMALALSPLLRDAHWRLGRIAAGRGRHAAAVAHYEAELIVNSDAAAVREDLATALDALGRAEEAAAARRAAAALLTARG